MFLKFEKATIAFLFLNTVGQNLTRTQLELIGQCRCLISSSWVLTDDVKSMDAIAVFSNFREAMIDYSKPQGH